VDLLLEALLSPGPQARRAWAAWRAALDVDSLPYGSQQLLPALSPAFPDWLEEGLLSVIWRFPSSRWMSWVCRAGNFSMFGDSTGPTATIGRRP
jgi:hypothetical protein